MKGKFIYCLPEEDLEYILTRTIDLWSQLKNKKLLITGGTGFFGIWFLESYLYAYNALNLNSDLIILTRDVKETIRKYPNVQNAGGITFIEGDLKTFKYPDYNVDFLIHAASGGSIMLNDQTDGSLVNNSIDGIRHLFDYARRCNGVKVLFTSSGAVYGKQPDGLTHIPENYSGAPDTMLPTSTYGESKRYCELLCALYGKQFNIEIKIARCFAFVGPFLPLTSNYAVGNFIYSSLKQEDIRILSDGTPRRSYLYSADLIIWLWTILFEGKSLYPYNVGSSDDLSIKELAEKVRNIVSPFLQIRVLGEKSSECIERYVPSVQRAFYELGLKQEIFLEEAICKTVKWYKNKV